MPISSAAAVPRIKPRDTSVSTSRSPHSKAPARRRQLMHTRHLPRGELAADEASNEPDK